MKLEINKLYMTKDKRVVRIVSKESTGSSFVSSGGLYYNEDGALVSSYRKLDLISEYIDE